MYAVIKISGKQYRVVEGQTLKIEKLTQDIGTFVKFKDVLLIGGGDELYIGSTQVKGAEVTAEIINQGRAAKINIIKFKRRKHQMKRMGHRQDFTTVKVVGIRVGGKEEV